MTGRTPGQRPTAERLLAVRTPMEIDFAPDGSRFAFTLQAVASDHGVTQPSDLWVVEGDARPRSAHRRRLGRHLSDLVAGRIASRLPLGSRRGGPPPSVHDGARRGAGPRGELPGVGRAAGLVGRRSPPAGPGRRSGLVLPRGVRNARHRRRVGARAGDPTFERCVAPPADGRPDHGRPERGGPPGWSVWEVGWDGAGATAIAVVAGNPTGNGWYRSRLARVDLQARTAEVLYEPRWQLEGLALSPDGRHASVIEGYSSDPGLLNGSVMVVDLSERRRPRPLAGARDGRRRNLVRRRVARLRADERNRDGLGTDLAGRRPRRSLGRRGVHRRRRLQAAGRPSRTAARSS